MFRIGSYIQQVSAFHCVARCRVAALCTTLLKSRANDTFCTTFIVRGPFDTTTPASTHPHRHRRPTHCLACLHLPPRPCPQHGCPCTTPAASHLCAYTPHRRHALRTHTATGVAATLRHTPRLRHTTRAPQAWRAVSHPLPHTRGVPFDCDPRTLPHAPQNSNFPNAKLTKARTTPGPLPHSTHDAPPRTHRELSQVLCTTHHSNRYARTTICDARPPRDDALHVQRLGARTGRQGARLVAARGA